MKHRKIINDVSIYASNMRAEDGMQPLSKWDAVREAVLIPMGFLFVVLLFVLLVSHSAIAQTGGGRIAGSVKDSTGAVIPGATVDLVNVATGVHQSTISNDGGLFNFPVVQVGQYEVDVAASGFTAYKQTEKIKIDVNTALSIDVTLQIAQVSQE